MLASLVMSRLMVPPDLASLALVFFTYSLLGYVMECIVLSIENRQLVTNRGLPGTCRFASSTALAP